MTPLQLLQEAARAALVDEDGEAVELELAPGLSDEELAAFAATLPCPLPDDVRALLRFSRGFNGVLEEVDFTGRDLAFEERTLFPHGVPIAHDGFGNFWVVDLAPDSSVFGPVVFACHDAPVVLHQSPDLAHFLAELIRLVTPPHASAIDDVHEDRLFRVWRTHPGVLDHAACLASDDPELAAFARELVPAFQLVDMRSPEVGFGFAWGRYGPGTEVRRFGTRPIFAYRKPPGLLARLLGRRR